MGDGGGRDAGDGVEDGEEEEDDDGNDDAGDARSSGYKDAGSSIAISGNSSSRERHVLDGVPVMASSIGSDTSSVGATL